MQDFFKFSSLEVLKFRLLEILKFRLLDKVFKSRLLRVSSSPPRKILWKGAVTTILMTNASVSVESAARISEQQVEKRSVVL
mmetsp:Transcript_65724/g.109066  ORF Transcript_65724/g.109066 Transcript_65724/m.109066 type:complete len:82 (+) Transcript_65724:36-281(+)